MVKNPLISICVPTFNQEDYIHETLDSILAQLTNIHYEIIIADDCSSDNTAKICKKYQERFPDKIKFISNEKNQGLIVNLFDTLFSSVRGKYIALCSGDDVWMNPKKIDIQFDILSNNNNISAIHTGFNFFYEVSNTLKPANPWTGSLDVKHGKEAIKDVIFENFSILPLASSIMFRKETIDRYRTKYDYLIKDKSTVGEGLILYSFIVLDGLFKYIPDITVNYRVREKSLCHFVDKDKELLFKIKFRIYHKTLLVKTFLNDMKSIKRIHRGFLSLYLSALENKTEKTFFEQYNSYKKENYKSIPFYVNFFISNNHLNKVIFIKVASLFFSWKNRNKVR